MQIVQSVSYSHFSETNSAKRLDLLTASLSCASFLTAMMVFFWQASVKPAWWQVGWSRLLRPNLVQTWILSSESTYPQLASQASLSHCRQEEGGRGRVAVIIEAHKEHATATVSQWTHRITSTQLASPFFVNLDYHRHHHHHDGNTMIIMVMIHDHHRDEDHQLRSSFRLRLEHQSNLCIHSSTLCLSTIQPINFNKIL